MKKMLVTTALALSLGMSGMALANPPVGGAPAAQGQRGEWLQKKISGLSPAGQKLVTESFQQGRDARKSDWEQKKKLHEEMRTIVTAPKFDRAAFLAKSKEMQALRAKDEAARAERMADLNTKLDQKDRTALADAFRHPPMHGRGGHGSQAPESGPDATPPAE